MNTTELERLVRVEVIMDEVRDDLKTLIAKIDNLESRVRAAEDAVSQAQVGWRVLVTLGTGAVTIAGTAGALMAKFLPFFSTLPR
jgi:hypothetical protein